MASPPTWLVKLANEVAVHIRPTDVLTPLGCHFHFHNDAQQWEISLFASQTQIVGGQYDGREVHCRFFVELKELVHLFDHVREFTWQASSLGADDEIGPHVSVEGRYHGHNVWVRVLAAPPQSMSNGRVALVYDNCFEELW